VAAVLALPDICDPLGIRDRAILETLYATGARRSELTNLDLSDLDQSSQTLLIRKGKGDKDRLLPIGKTALHWLENYLEKSRPKLLLETGWPKRSKRQGLKNKEAATFCDTVAPLTCTKTGLISESSSSF